MSLLLSSETGSHTVETRLLELMILSFSLQSAGADTVFAFPGSLRERLSRPEQTFTVRDLKGVILSLMEACPDQTLACNSSHTRAAHLSSDK